MTTLEVERVSASRSKRTPLETKNDRDEEAEADRLQLAPEVRVGHHLVAVDERDDRAGDERAEDDLEPERVGDGGEADEQHERGADADLRGRVLQPQQVGADAHRVLRAAHHAEDDGGEREQRAEQQQRRAGAALAGEEDRQQDDRAEVGDRRGRDDQLAEASR